jgi:hypothetical protein
MATAFAPNSPFLAPFLLTPRPAAISDVFADALRGALFAEAKANGVRRTERCRIAHLLCELRLRLARSGASVKEGEPLPISRADLSGMLGISLVRVKRALGLLSLSQVISTDGRSIAVTDWPRLCAVAGFEAARLSLAPAERSEDWRFGAVQDETRTRFTAAGDPACFV